MAKKTRARIAIIDDDANLLRMLSMVLERVGYEVHVAANGVEGLSLIQSVKPDLVVIDMLMPYMRGSEMAEQLRERPETSQIPIIMLSTLTGIDDKLEGFESGADDYVTKPVNSKELLARINALLTRARFGRQPLARTIILVGAKGGVGVTTLTANLAAALAQREHTVAIAELHEGRGALRYLLNLPSVPNLRLLLQKEAESITRRDVERQVVRHPSGVKVLLAPDGSPDGAHPFTAAHAAAIIAALQRESEFLLLDVPYYHGGLVKAALGASDQALLVVEPEVLSAMCAKSIVAALADWDDTTPVAAVAMAKVTSGIQLTRTELENEIGLAAAAGAGDSLWETRQEGETQNIERVVLEVIPPAPEAFQDAVRAGVPLVRMEPSSGAARAIQSIAERLSSSAEAKETHEV